MGIEGTRKLIDRLFKVTEERACQPEDIADRSRRVSVGIVAARSGVHRRQIPEVIVAGTLGLDLAQPR